MRHLMWILTWIAVAIGGVLGAASVIMLSARNSTAPPAPDVIARDREPVYVNKPRPGPTTGHSLVVAPNRTARAVEHAGAVD